MTIIYDKGDFWIEFLQSTRQNVDPGNARSVVFNLTKPGSFVGMSGYVDTDGTSVYGGIILETPALGKINYGDKLSQVNAISFNIGINPSQMSVAVMVFLRK